MSMKMFAHLFRADGNSYGRNIRVNQGTEIPPKFVVCNERLFEYRYAKIDDDGHGSKYLCCHYTETTDVEFNKE